MLYKSFILIFFISFQIICFTACDNDTNSSIESTIEENWELQIVFDMNEPVLETVNGSGNALLVIEDDFVTITGIFSRGDLSFTNLKFDGELHGAKFILLTKSFQILYQLNGIAYTENIAITLPDIIISDNTAIGGGEIEITRNPGKITESGTFTFVATKK